MRLFFIKLILLSITLILFSACKNRQDAADDEFEYNNNSVGKIIPPPTDSLQKPQEDTVTIR